MGLVSASGIRATSGARGSARGRWGSSDWLRPPPPMGRRVLAWLGAVSNDGPSKRSSWRGLSVTVEVSGAPWPWTWELSEMRPSFLVEPKSLDTLTMLARMARLTEVPNLPREPPRLLPVADALKDAPGLLKISSGSLSSARRLSRA